MGNLKISLQFKSFKNKIFKKAQERTPQKTLIVGSLDKIKKRFIIAHLIRICLYKKIISFSFFCLFCNARCDTWRSLKRVATRPCPGCATSPKTEVGEEVTEWCRLPVCQCVRQWLGNSAMWWEQALYKCTSLWRGYSVGHEATCGNVL